MLCFVDAEWSLFAKPFALDGVWVGWPKALGERLLSDGLLPATDLTAVGPPAGDGTAVGLSARVPARGPAEVDDQASAGGHARTSEAGAPDSHAGDKPTARAQSCTERAVGEEAGFNPKGSAPGCHRRPASALAVWSSSLGRVGRAEERAGYSQA